MVFFLFTGRIGGGGVSATRRGDVGGCGERNRRKVRAADAARAVAGFPASGHRRGDQFRGRTAARFRRRLHRVVEILEFSIQNTLARVGRRRCSHSRDVERRVRGGAEFTRNDAYIPF